MTFDGSPEHNRHGVGGFPRLTKQPPRNRPIFGRWVLVMLLTVAIVLAGVVVVVLVVV